MIARRTRTAAMVVVVAAALTLTGCAAGETYPAATAQRLQSGVRDVAATSATQDYAGALAKLDALQAQSDAAQKAGDLDHARYLAVSRSIATVRTDLTQLRAAAEQTRLEQQMQELQQQQTQKNEGKGNKGHGDGGD